MAAAEYTDHRLPELFCGYSRSDYPQPLPYPTACSPQAWAATTPIMLIRSLLRYDAHLSLGGLWIDPVLPESWGDFNATNVDMGGSRFSFNVSPGLKLRISPKELSSTGERALHWLTLRNLTGSARRNDRR